MTRPPHSLGLSSKSAPSSLAEKGDYLLEHFGTLACALSAGCNKCLLAQHMQDATSADLHINCRTQQILACATNVGRNWCLLAYQMHEAASDRLRNKCNKCSLARPM
eukprot:1144660-Pelagomonas_calceolata.AAC.11